MKKATSEVDDDLRPEYDLSKLKGGVRGKYAGLPLPKWCFVLIAVPTFYMPLAYLTFFSWAVGEMFFGKLGRPPEWLAVVIGPAIWTTVVMWPIYVAWVAISRRLTLREKGLWLVIVSLGNMIGMPIFYVFMLRRYLGVEGRTGPRDESALDRFLARCGINRSELSPDQQRVLRSYCRNHRLAKWAILPAVVVAALLCYGSIVLIPGKAIPMFSDFVPTRVIVVDAAKNTRKEISPDADAIKQYVQVVLLIGAMAGGYGTMGFVVLLATISQLGGNRHRKAIVDFLKANRERSDLS
jgi:hypothetical protein